jgi:PAS domain S-box-containing protein
MPESNGPGPGAGASIPEPSNPPLGLLYRRFFEHAPLEVHIWQVVRDTRQAIVNWRLVDANPAALTSWGRRLEEVLGRTADEIFPDTGAVRSFLPVVEAIMASSQPRQWEMPFAATGQVLRMVSVPVGDCFVSTGVDVTAERSRQQELEHALQQVTRATQAGGVGLWDWDLRTQAVRYSDEWKRQLGHAPEDIVDSFEAWRSRVHPDDLGPTLAAAQAALDDPTKPYDVTLRMRHRDGTYRWVLGQGSVFRDETGQPYRMVGSQIDITEQRQLKADLQLERDKHRVMLRNASDGMCIINDQGCIEEVSDSFGTLLGYARDEMLGMPISQWQLTDDASAADAGVAAMIAAGQRVQFETRHRRRDGVVLDVEVSAVPFELDGRVLLFCITRDISERKKTQSELEAARNSLEEQVAKRTADLTRAVQEAREADRAKTVFLSSMSHELRTPLNAVLGYAQLLASAPLESIGAVQREQARLIEASAEHLLALVNDLLDLARIEHEEVVLDPRAVDVLSLLQGVRDGIEPLARRAGVEVRVAVEGRPGELRAHADATRMQQCVLNLVSNGIKYNRSGGRVDLAARAEAGGVAIQVTDTGRGMTAAQLAHLFERFNRLGAEGSDIEGSGIGLFITRELLRRMGGRIEVDSEPGRGTSFSLWLPAATEPAPVAAAPRDAESRPVSPAVRSMGGARVEALYVEDNEVNVALLQAMAARRPGIALRVARSGNEALASLRERPARLLLMDMNLGDCHGLELIDRLRSERDDPKRLHVAVSADASVSSIDRALAAGFHRYITKPIKIEVLLGLFDELLQEAAASGPG